MVEHRPISEEDIVLAAQSGVGADFAFSESRVLEVIEGGLGSSIETRTYCIDGDPVCLMGVMSEGLLASHCHIWMIALPKLEEHKVAFARHVPRLLGSLPYTSVSCLCDPGFTRTVRWLSHTGFAKVGEVEIDGRPFDQLERKL